MRSFLYWFSTLLLCCACYGSSYTPGDVRNCLSTSQISITSSAPLLRMDTVPGLGFDNLRNIDKGKVFYMNYSTCSKSNDGYYLLPDEVYLVPVLKSDVDFYASIYEKFDEWKSTTSASINNEAESSWGHIGGKFSTEYQNTKTKMVDTKSQAVRVGLRHHLYSVHVNVDAQLHPSFKSRIMDLAAHIQSNNTELAHYMADLIVRDYGTHVVTSIEAGAALYQTTYISRDSTKDSHGWRLSISASASASFESIFNIKMSTQMTHTNDQVHQIQNATTHKVTSTHGGPPFKLSNFSYADWENDIRNNLVAIDRRGEPLYTAITTTNMAELPDVLLLQTVDYIYKAVSRYYRINTHFGCTDPTSSNFDFHANSEDNSCHKEHQNYTFGGIYQMCENHQDDLDICNEFSANQTNPLTSDFSCPTGYHRILLHTGTLKKSKPVQVCQKCSRWHKFWHRHCPCTMTYPLKYATYHAYWCTTAPGETASTDSGYAFGGLYSSKHTNPMTGSFTCPPFFYPLHFGEDIKVCVSNDVEAGSSLPFGGFLSCTAGNPLAATATQFQQGIYPHACPVRYNQFLVTVDQQGCIINYCSKITSFLAFTPRPPVIPPYKTKPPKTVNISNTLAIVGPHGNMWIKGDDGTWSKYTSDDQTGMEYIQSLFVSDDAATPTANASNVSLSDDDTNGRLHLTTSEGVGIAVGTAVSTVLVIAIVAMLGCGINKFRKRLRNKKDLLMYLDQQQNKETAALVRKLDDEV